MATPGPEEKARQASRLRAWGPPLGLLLAWSLFTGLYRGPRRAFFPTPLAVLGATLERWRSGHLLPDVGVSLGQVALGFSVGGLLGAAFGLLLGGLRSGERALGGLFNGLRQVPAVAWAPILVLWFGVGELSSAVFLSLGVFFPVALVTASGLAAVPVQQHELGAVLGLGRWERLRSISLPSALPSLKAAALQGLNMAWVGLLALDLLSPSPWGLGTQITQGCLSFRMDQVYSGLILIAVLGALSQWGLRRAWTLLLGRYEVR